MTRGEEAERKVLARLTAALPDAYRVYPNVSWTSPTRPGAPATDGEADVVIAHAELGILVVEVKSGEPTRDASGRWWLGPHQLDRSPFVQAKDNKYALAKKIASMPGWPHGPEGPIAGHAVAFPDVDLAAAGHARPSMGEDAPPQIILDAHGAGGPRRDQGVGGRRLRLLERRWCDSRPRTRERRAWPSSRRCWRRP